jgi:hypothetical protein
MGPIERGGARRHVILAAEDVADLQYFLLDAAKRYVVGTTGTLDDASDLLASAAALDYVMLLSSEPATETLEDDSPIALGVRETLARAAGAALDFIETMRDAPADVRRDFMARHAGDGGVFSVLRRMRERDALTSDDVAFRKLTLASDLREC